MFSTNILHQESGSVIFGCLWYFLRPPQSIALKNNSTNFRRVKNIPGPFLAMCTNWWRFFSIYNNRSVQTQRFLHDKYGSAVQLGPNLVSLSDPNLLRTLYNTRGDYLKVRTLANLIPNSVSDKLEHILRCQLLQSCPRNHIQRLLNKEQ